MGQDLEVPADIQPDMAPAGHQVPERLAVRPEGAVYLQERTFFMQENKLYSLQIMNYQTKQHMRPFLKYRLHRKEVSLPLES